MKAADGFPWHRTEPGPGGCILWTGRLSEDGYGMSKRKCGSGWRTYRAHRLGYELNTGPILRGLHVLHSCDVRNCVNPAHLSLGTNADNVADREARGRTSHATGNPGELHPLAILTAADVSFIRSANLGGVPQSALARAYGVSRSAINQIVLKRTWTAEGASV